MVVNRRNIFPTVLSLILLSVLLLGVGSVDVMADRVPPEEEWYESYGWHGSEGLNSFVQNSEGGYVIAGFTDSHGEGLNDFCIMEIDSVGEIVWFENYGGIGNDEACSLVQTIDGGYAMSGFTESYGSGGKDFWLVKIDETGDLDWSENYGGSGSEESNSIIQTSDGGYALIGTTDSYGAGGNNFWLVKTDSEGQMRWSETYGDNEDQQGMDLIQTTDNGYVLFGFTKCEQPEYSHEHLFKYDFWLVKVDSEGNEEWSKTYGRFEDDYGFSLVRASDGGYVLSGKTIPCGMDKCGLEGADSFVLKTDSDGNEEWSNTFGEIGDDWTSSVVKTSDGGYALAGRSVCGGGDNSEDYDFSLVKIDSEGDLVFSGLYGDNYDEWASGLVQTSDNGYILAGTTGILSGDSENDSNDFLILKTSEEGSILYNLSVVSVPLGSGVISPSGGDYEDGTEVTLTAEPRDNYEFIRWSGDASGTDNQVTITMVSDKSLNAEFSPSDKGEGDLPFMWIFAGMSIVTVFAVLLFWRVL